MSISETARVRQHARTAARVVNGQAVVIVIDAQALHTLNDVGTHIWGLVDGDGRTLGEVVDDLVVEFEVDRDTALADASAFVDELRRLGAIEVEA